MKGFFFILILIFFSAFFAGKIYAFDPSRPNNIVGIHLAQPRDEDLRSAAKLVNSSGGDWGYVTLVIQENDRDHDKWQAIFDSLRELHLIPIIRLATNPEGSNWRRPNPEDAANWANFLDSLNWVVKDRYIVLFNETNHATEWGGAVDAASYASIAKTFAEELKKRNSDYFIMLGGLDASAPSAGTNYESEDEYLPEVISYMGKDSFETLFDGLSSHSYPNPGFAGSPTDTGRGTVRNYEWELSLLKNMGINKDLPVFITETGWSANAVSRDAIGAYLKTAYKEVWKPDNRVRAVTPFVLNYQADPFLGFSWEKQDSADFYSQYADIQSMEKTQGRPEQIEKARFVLDFPRQLTVTSDFHLTFMVENLGQSIWSVDDDYKLGFRNGFPGSYFFSDIQKLKPFETTKVNLYLKTDGTIGNKTATLTLLHGDRQVGPETSWNYEQVPWPSAQLKVLLYPKVRTDGGDFTFQLFDTNEELVFQRKNVDVAQGQALVGDIRNIAFGKRYRAVILKSYYLPRQTYLIFHKGQNDIAFPFMLPLDFNNDGKFDVSDLVALIQNLSLLSLLFPQN